MSTFFEIIAGQLHFSGTYMLPLPIVVMVPLLLVASIVDIRERRVPNCLVVTGMVGAIALHALTPQGEGLGFALAGLTVGMASLLPMYALRVMGAGDVKLMGMIGGFLGIDGVLGAMLASMVAGGIFALVLAGCKRMLPELLANLRSVVVQVHIKRIAGPRAAPIMPVSVGSMPYAVAITAGTLAQLTFLHL